MYCFYVASFNIIALCWSPPFPTLAYITAVTGSIVGGFGAGFLWTAQVHSRRLEPISGSTS
jgi:hypothetical protein